MPAEERPSRGPERCRLHPASHAIATCDGCGRGLCLACAIPVRGRTLGAECLATVLGPEVPLPEVPVPEPGAAARGVARWAFALAVLATLLPWSGSGVGSGAFGAWTDAPRWSTLAAAAAVVGLLVTVARRLVALTGSSWDAGSAAAGLLVAVGAALAAWHPPGFSAPWLGPWIALVAGALACGACVVALRRERLPDLVRS